MTPEFARELDDKIAFVLGMRFSEAIHANDWSAAIRAIELLDPVIARLGSGTRENEFRRYLVRLAQALPAEHLREKEFVQRASFLIHRRTEEEDDEAIPTGTMVPGPLPGGGTLVNEDGAASDFKTVLACLPDFSNAIKDVNRIVMVSEVPYFAGWHLVEVMPRLRQANDLPVASRAFFVSGEKVAPIVGDARVFLAIAKDSGIDLSSIDTVKDYVRMHIACRIASRFRAAGRVVEADDVLPFREGIDDTTKELIKAKIEDFAFRKEDGKYRGSGSMIFFGNLHRFEIEVSCDGNITFEKVEPRFVASADDDGKQRATAVFYDYQFTETGWRILTDLQATSVDVDPVASGSTPPTNLPTTLPSTQEGEQVKSRPCVVSPPGATNFAGLRLRSPKEDEIRRVADIPRQLPAGTLDNFDLDGARVASLSFLPSWTLVLLPHRETRVSVPFLIGPQPARIVGRQNEWLYSLMERDGAEPGEAILTSFSRFFFAVIVGKIGNFKIVEFDAELPWSEAASEADRERAQGIVTPIHYLGRSADGVSLLFMYVVFKNALFRTNCRIAKNWQAELVNEELILEDQPFLQGPAFNLVVSH